jgi:multiple sugar transport system ATP-binding protein
MAEVVLKNVCKVFGGTTVVKDVCLEIGDGEFMVLVGPSGCGKTTTLRMVAGLEEVSSGEIYIGSRLVNNVPPKDRDIAMVFQSYALYPHMTVFENMSFGLRLRGMPKDEIEKRVLNAAKLLGLEGLLNRKPKQLSGGQRQRVAMGRAIVREPKVFLFDEPLSNLDAKFRVAMRIELKMLQRRLGTTTIYVTHDQTEAMTLADRIAIMENGRVRQVGTPKEVFEMPKDLFVASFIGSPEMNFIKGRVEVVEGDVVVKSKSQAFRMSPEQKVRLARMEGASVTLGIRPVGFVLGANDGLTQLQGAVEVIENLGSEKYAYIRTEDGLLTVRLEPHETVKEKENVVISVLDGQVHCFDEEGKNILGG